MNLVAALMEPAAIGPRINKFGEPAIIAYNQEENFPAPRPWWVTF
jgi:hypothetical protein